MTEPTENKASPGADVASKVLAILISLAALALAAWMSTTSDKGAFGAVFLFLVGILFGGGVGALLHGWLDRAIKSPHGQQVFRKAGTTMGRHPRLFIGGGLALIVLIATSATWADHAISAKHDAERAQAREQARVVGLAHARDVCRILRQHDPRYDSIESLRDLDRQIPYSAAGYILRRCPSRYSMMNERIEQSKSAPATPSAPTSPTWESEDCSQRYQAISSDLFTAAEQDSMRMGVDADCANLTPAR